MIEKEEVTISFPGLTYLGEPHSGTVAAKLPKDQNKVLVVGGSCNGKWTGQSLKDALSEFGQSTSGTKDLLLERLAGLAVEMYGKHEQQLDEYFTENSYIRIARSTSGCFLFPLLQDQSSIGRMVLAMYILKHLRGKNTILDPAHVKQGYSASQLANALVHGRVVVGGGFVQVA